VNDAHQCRLPVPLDFRPALLQILGKIAKFKSGVFVDRREITAEVIRATGYDPDRLDQYGDPALGWKRTGTLAPEGFDRKVQRAFLNGYQKRPGSPLTVSGGNYLWGLTELGVEEGFRQFCLHDRTDPRNATSRFLDRRLKETKGGLMRLLNTAVATNLPICAVTGQVEDHVQTCFTRLIVRDALRGRIESGNLITDEMLATFAVRSGYTDIRNAGTEPVTRELYGTRTARERAKGLTVGPMSDPRLVWDAENDPGHWVDVADTDSSMTAESVEDRIFFEQVWQHVEQIVLGDKPRAGKRYTGVLRQRCNDMMVGEISKNEGVSKHRAASMLAEVRRVMRKADEKGLLNGLLRP
jgi:hypothetical protein